MRGKSTEAERSNTKRGSDATSYCRENQGDEAWRARVRKLSRLHPAFHLAIQVAGAPGGRNRVPANGRSVVSVQSPGSLSAGYYCFQNRLFLALK